jgi:hypothetical protein
VVDAEAERARVLADLEDQKRRVGEEGFAQKFKGGLKMMSMPRCDDSTYRTAF